MPKTPGNTGLQFITRSSCVPVSALMERPADWTDRVNAPLSAKELGRVRVSLERGRPYGEDEWVKRTASELRLEHTIRPEGRPPKLRNWPRPRFAPDEPRRLAAVRLVREALGQTFQTTALVHEAYLRLVDTDPTRPWDGRGHLFAAAEAMRASSSTAPSTGSSAAAAAEGGPSRSSVTFQMAKV